MFKYYIFSCCICVFVCVLNASGQTELLEGDRCYSEEDKINGTCVSVKQCLSAIDIIKQKKYPQICSFNGLEPIVCCTDCELFDSSQYLIGNNGHRFKKTGKKASDKCLEYYLSIQDPDLSCSLPMMGVRVQVRRSHGECYVNTADEDVQYFTWVATSEASSRMLSEPKRYVFWVHLASSQNIRRKKRTPQDPRPTAVPSFSNAYGSYSAYEAQYPLMALLGYGADVESAQWLCGASLISHRFLLTAAHCSSSATLGPVRHIALGILKRSFAPDTWHQYTVKDIIPHPQYKSPSKYHDIALLKTNEWITFSRLVLPICLYDGGIPRHELDENKAIATGWGVLGPRAALADILQVVNLTSLSDEECAAAYPPNRNLLHGYDPVTQLCYGDKVNSSDTCQGDSGGPLMESSKGCTRRVVGVTSYGRECGAKVNGSAGIYTRVEYYVPWIESIVWP